MHPLLANALVHQPMRSLLAPLTRGKATILTLHRFGPDGRFGRHTVAGLSGFLGWLRRHRFPILPLLEVVDTLRAGGPIPPGAVCFTIDDGYADFHDLAAPVFLAHDVPVSVFLTTGFIDRESWMWWDQIGWAFASSPRHQVMIRLSAEPLELPLSTAEERRSAGRRIVAHMKTLGDSARHESSKALMEQLGVELPASAPDSYAPMDWDQIRNLETRGVRFGPHSVTHPVLSNLDDDRCREEILRSRDRLVAECDSPLPVFCYPNGLAGDFGIRELRLVEEAGFRAALTMLPGHASAKHCSPTGACSLPRYPYGEAPGYLPQVVLGLEGLKHSFRGRSAA